MVVDEWLFEEDSCDLDFEVCGNGLLLCFPLSMPLMNLVTDLLHLDAANDVLWDLVVAGYPLLVVSVCAFEKKVLETCDECWGVEVVLIGHHRETVTVRKRFVVRYGEEAVCMVCEKSRGEKGREWEWKMWRGFIWMCEVMLMLMVEVV